MIPWELRRGQIKRLLYEQCLNGRISWEVFKEHLHELNKVAPVVRCEDCKHRGTEKCVSYEAFWELGDDGFCSCGEKEKE